MDVFQEWRYALYNNDAISHFCDLHLFLLPDAGALLVPLYPLWGYSRVRSSRGPNAGQRSMRVFLY